jgi:hypothetical protein
LATQKLEIKKQARWRKSKRRKMKIKLKTCVWDAAKNFDTDEVMQHTLKTLWQMATHHL